MTEPKNPNEIVVRIEELSRRKQAANAELAQLKREALMMVCVDEAQANPPSLFVAYDRQGAWEFGARCQIMRKATIHQRSRCRMFRGPKNQSK